MADNIEAGTILIREGTPLPDSLRFESSSCSNGWRFIKNLNGYGLDRQIREAGWTFFCTAGEITASVFGFGTDKSTDKAIKRALAGLKSDKFNCLEITQVAVKRFLGLPYVSVCAYSRQIQQSPWTKDFAEWDRAKLAAV
jgi:hypothetical protein